MVDVCRHFFNKEEIKNYLDLMAQHKLNVFHWHLTEDEGWRIEIKRYPKLTEVGAWRKAIGWNLDPKSSTAWGPDGRYGGFYTQDDVREIVAYAKARYITVVPEIEMPGHAIAALASYPELSCTGGPYTTDDRPKEYSDIFCAGKDSTFEFLEGVLAEVIELFPSKLIHIGGDEAGKALWKKCEKCQARIRQEGLKDEKQLQSYFIRRIEKFVNAQGRNLIGWDEILEGGLAPNATVMSWRGIEGGIEAANTGHDAVMAPQPYIYINRPEAPAGTPVKNPRANRGVLTLDMVYAYEPVPQEVPAEKAKHIIGAEGPLWTEGTPNYARLQLLTYPRACAIAELTWLEGNQKDWQDFRRRIKSHLKRLQLQAVNYYPSVP
jgi:hexosaminidase